MVRGGGRGAGSKEAVLVPLLSKGGQWDQQQGAPGGKERPKKTRNGNYVITTVDTLICCQKKTQ
jgi:hypothetical protein